MYLEKFVVFNWLEICWNRYLKREKDQIKELRENFFFFWGVHLILLAPMDLAFGGQAPQDQGKGKRSHPLTLRNRQMGKWAVDWHHLSGDHLTCERLIQVNSLKFIRIFLSLQKEINFRYISITTVICTESYIVEKAVSRLLPLSLGKSSGKWFWLKALTIFSLIWRLGIYRLGRCF